MAVPARPKIYHIVHVDRLPSILASDGLLSDAEMVNRDGAGTTIGMGGIKQRRLQELSLESHPGLYVGQCVPFYFSPRSIMLYLIYQANHPELAYRGGQGPILHLEADLHDSVEWAEDNDLRWAFTLSNAGSYYFEDRNNLNDLDEINWQAVNARRWAGDKEGKQAEFLVEKTFHWDQIERIGVRSQDIATQVTSALVGAGHKPRVEIIHQWYY